jgi:hypothetical protein
MTAYVAQLRAVELSFTVGGDCEVGRQPHRCEARGSPLAQTLCHREDPWLLTIVLRSNATLRWRYLCVRTRSARATSMAGCGQGSALFEKNADSRSVDNSEAGAEQPCPTCSRSLLRFRHEGAFLVIRAGSVDQADLSELFGRWSASIRWQQV